MFSFFFPILPSVFAIFWSDIFCPYFFLFSEPISLLFFLIFGIPIPIFPPPASYFGFLFFSYLLNFNMSQPFHCIPILTLAVIYCICLTACGCTVSEPPHCHTAALRRLGGSLHWPSRRGRLGRDDESLPRFLS